MRHPTLAIDENYADTDRVDEGRKQGKASRRSEVCLHKSTFELDFGCHVARHGVNEFIGPRWHCRPGQPAVTAVPAFVSIPEMDDLGTESQLLGFS